MGQDFETAEAHSKAPDRSRNPNNETTQTQTRPFSKPIQIWFRHQENLWYISLFGVSGLFGLSYGLLHQKAYFLQLLYASFVLLFLIKFF